MTNITPEPHVECDWDKDGNARYTMIGIKTVSKIYSDALIAAHNQPVDGMKSAEEWVRLYESDEDLSVYGNSLNDFIRAIQQDALRAQAATIASLKERVKELEKVTLPIQPIGEHIFKVGYTDKERAEIQEVVRKLPTPPTTAKDE